MSNPGFCTKPELRPTEMAFFVSPQADELQTQGAAANSTIRILFMV